MSIWTTGPDGWPEEIIEAIKAIAGAYEEIVEKVKEFAELAVDRAEIERSIERKERREAALLAGQKGAARAKAYGMRMQQEKARRALRRRKRLHGDRCSPDW